MTAIRKIENKDYQEVYEIYAHYVEQSSAIFEIQPRSFSEMEKEWQSIQEKYPFYVAVHDEKVIGYAYIHEAFSREAYRYCTELSIYFQPGNHHGLASKLLEQVEDDAKRQNVKWIIACVTDSNESSIQFHKKHGYVLQGALPECGFKFDAWHGVMWLCKNLEQEMPSYRIAKNATVVGNVQLDADVNVWYGAVIRADREPISIGQGTNIQDQCTLHVEFNYPLVIGKNCTVGHNAIVHGATIEDEVMIGMGAIVLNGAHVEKHCIIAAGSVVLENAHIPSGSIVAGVPGKVIKTLSPEQIQSIQENAKHYIELSKEQL